MAEVLMLVLRVLHVVGGAFWFGASVVVTVFLGPTVRSLGPEGGRFMTELVERRRFAMFMTIAGDVTVLVGLALLGHNMASEIWRASTYGQVMMAGSATGMLALAVGHAVNAPTAKKMTRLGAQMQAAGGAPSAEQRAELTRLQKRLHTGSVAGSLLLLLTVIAMASASQL